MTLTIRSRPLEVVARPYIEKGSLTAREFRLLVANVADQPGRRAPLMLKVLETPGLTRRQQVELVRTGLGAEERRTLISLLDGPMNLTPGQRRFLEDVLRRGAAQQQLAQQAAKAFTDFFANGGAQHWLERDDPNATRIVQRFLTGIAEAGVKVVTIDGTTRVSVPFYDSSGGASLDAMQTSLEQLLNVRSLKAFRQVPVVAVRVG